jgi:hypothetical protein
VNVVLVYFSRHSVVAWKIPFVRPSRVRKNQFPIPVSNRLQAILPVIVKESFSRFGFHISFEDR